MKKGQLTLVGFVITFIVVVMVIVLSPIVKDVVRGTADSSFGEERGPNYWVLVLFPTIMLLAAVMGFFVWNSTVTR